MSRFGVYVYFIEPKISHIERRFLNLKFLKNVMYFLVYNCKCTCSYKLLLSGGTSKKLGSLLRFLAILLPCKTKDTRFSFLLLFSCKREVAHYF